MLRLACRSAHTATRMWRYAHSRTRMCHNLYANLSTSQCLCLLHVSGPWKKCNQIQCAVNSQLYTASSSPASASTPAAFDVAARRRRQRRQRRRLLPGGNISLGIFICRLPENIARRVTHDKRSRLSDPIWLERSKSEPGRHTAVGGALKLSV